MKVIILAAGKGTRYSIEKPKTLCQIVGNKTILDFQVERLTKKIGRKNIGVVVGYKKEKIIEKYPDLDYFYNQNFANTNNSKSLLLALQKINEDVLILDADVYFDEEVLDLMIPSEDSSCLVNRVECIDEEMRYDINEKGLISRMSKSIRQHKGEALGIHLLKKRDLLSIINELKIISDHEFDCKAYDNLIRKGKLKLKPVYVEPFFCKDIDFEKDLEEVKQHLSSFPFQK